MKVQNLVQTSGVGVAYPSAVHTYVFGPGFRRGKRWQNFFCVLHCGRLWTFELYVLVVNFCVFLCLVEI